MPNGKKHSEKTREPDEEKKDFMDKLEENVDEASHEIMNLTGDINHRLEEAVDDLEEVVSDGLNSVKDGARHVIEYAEDKVEAVELRGELSKLHEEIDTVFLDAGRKMWALYQSGQLETVEEACAKQISRMKKLQHQIDKKDKALLSVS